MAYDIPTTNLDTTFAPMVAAHRGEFLMSEIRSKLTLRSEGDLTVVWSPFDHVPSTAKLVFVGITPGTVQAENALVSFRAALQNGHSPAEASRKAKLAASFSGPMRENLVAMLDHIGAHNALGVPTCAAVFQPEKELAHFTSALRHPVFVRGENYNGTPDMIRTICLRRIVETFLASEALSLPGAIWLPLGPKALAAVLHLVSAGVIRRDRVLEGLPHPSGANGERIAYFLGRKAARDLSAKTKAAPIDAAREALRIQLSRYAA